VKALVYNGPRDVSVSQVPDPGIDRPGDAVIQVTRTNICGSDLHMYEGRTDIEPGRVLGHENMGRVVETGPAVEQLRPGDMVTVPFNVACGHCSNCERGLTSYCQTANPDPHTAGAAYGFAGMGPWNGGQAEYLKIPWADFNALPLADDAEEKQNDYVMLSDIFPTGYHATEMANVSPGDTVVIYGAGPVGLMAAYSALIKGAAHVMVVDRHPDRLALAQKIGATPIDDSRASPVDQVLNLTGGLGADAGCECVGYQAHDPAGHEHPNQTLNELVNSVKYTGAIGVVGIYPPADPGGSDDLARHGEIAFDYGSFWTKGQQMGTGQCPVKTYDQKLRDLIHTGKATPSFVISHQLPLDQAPQGYQHFDNRDKGWTKVTLSPAG
jgi:glutathione-independent formaldehyde dehydrogenase